MIVYLETKNTFRDDVFANRIEEKVRDTLKAKGGKTVSESEINSWKNSLRFMDAIVEDAEIPADTGIAIEFNIPNTSKRIDFILTGKQADGSRTAVIVELKQWQHAEVTNKDAIVHTFLGGGKRDTNQPSYKAWSYATLIEDPAYAGSYTIKVYKSHKVPTDGGWEHQAITLEPRSNHPEFETLRFNVNQAGDLQVIGELITLID